LNIGQHDNRLTWRC